MDLDAGEEAAEMRDEASQQVPAATPRRVRHPMEHQRVEAGVAQRHLQPRPQCRIALDVGVDLGEKVTEHPGDLRRSLVGKWAQGQPAASRTSWQRACVVRASSRRGGRDGFSPSAALYRAWIRDTGIAFPRTVELRSEERRGGK